MDYLARESEPIDTVDHPDPPPLRHRLDYAKAITAELLSEMAQAIGTGPALVLARRFGGRPLYIPKRPGPGHKLTRCLGAENARRLGAAFGGERFIIPCARAYLRWLDARALRILGRPINEIARHLGVNDRHIRRLLYGFHPERYEADETVCEIGRLYGVDGAD
ncbi:MAG TPA: hypothetical protein VKS60_12465 [Stellaceae bacterium]|nr:hypothetical protein [Stellaceae bacterium]